MEASCRSGGILPSLAFQGPNDLSSLGPWGPRSGPDFSEIESQRRKKHSRFRRSSSAFALENLNPHIGKKEHQEEQKNASDDEYFEE
jgi:hypothetical protein